MQAELKRGDFVKIIRNTQKQLWPDTYELCDIYCGYFGEIKHISKDIITIKLEAINNYPQIDIHRDFLVKRSFS